MDNNIKEDYIEQLVKLKKLVDDGILTQEEFETRKKIILDEVNSSNTSKVSKDRIVEKPEKVYNSETINNRNKSHKKEIMIAIIGIAIFLIFSIVISIITPDNKKGNEENNQVTENIEETNESDEKEFVPVITDNFHILDRDDNEEKEIEIPLDEYKELCDEYNYKDISRNPKDYEGKRAHFKAKVIQVSEYNDYCFYRMDVTKGSYDIWDDTIYVEYVKKYSDESRILEDDIVDVYGELDGLETYTSVLNAEITIPRLIAKYIVIR